MFGTVIDRVQSLLSRSFLLASFFPVLIFGAVNAALTAATFPELAGRAFEAFSKQPELYGPAALVGVGIAAYLLSPLVPVFRSLLEGEFLPRPLRTLLRIKYVREGERNRRRTRDSLARLAARRKQTDLQTTALQAARAAGRATGVDSWDFTRGAAWLAAFRLASAWLALWGLSREQKRNGIASERTVERTARRLGKALASASADIPANLPSSKWSRRLNGLQVRFLDALKAARDEAEQRFQQASEQERRSVLAGDPRPTRIGNLRAVEEGYIRSAYGVDFEFLWPRLQLVLAKDERSAARVEAAKAQLDFALLLLMLIVLVPAFWLPLLAWKADSPWLFLVLGVSCPLFAAFFRRLVEETQKGFGEVLQAAIDGFRLDLLKVLRLPPPPNLSQERDAWQRLARALRDGVGGDQVRFRHNQP